MEVTEIIAAVFDNPPALGAKTVGHSLELFAVTMDRELVEKATNPR